MTTAPQQRLSSLDMVRGLIMILMALDHTRDFFHIDAFRFSPEDFHHSHLALFFTRWITHLCAPLFLLLAGISIALYQEKKGALATSRYLVGRGLWLIVLELTLVQLAWHFSYSIHYIPGLVIWVIGWSMIVSACFTQVPKYMVAAVALALLFLHNTLDGFSMTGNTITQLIWSFLHQPDRISLPGDFTAFMLYPLIPALGIMLLGYALGQWYLPTFPSSRRQRYLLTAGVLSTITFFFARWWNWYGDAKSYVPQGNTADSLMVFFDVTKYPFSLHYCLATLGIGFLLLYAAEKIKSAVTGILVVFGQVPLFFYLLHLYFLHALAVLCFAISDPDLTAKQLLAFFERTDYGYSLATVYLIWILTGVVFYYLCRLYGRYKQGHRNFITSLF